MPIFRQSSLTLPALLLLGAIAAPRAAEAQAPAPPGGLVALRNGNILEGQVTEAGDFLIVTLGKSELRLKTGDVEFWCRDLDEAYARKVAAMDQAGARCHLDLAEWCLRQKMVERAAEQVMQAVRIEPDHPRIPLLEARLQLAVDASLSRPVKSDTPAVEPEEDLERMEQELPRGTVEKFTTFVQPILMNRCATAKCHGSEADNSFRLVRPQAGALIQKRTTQRNLAAVLRQIDRTQPEESKLLVAPLKEKGHAAGPIFDQKSRIQWEQLAAWVRQASRPAEVATPASIVQPVTHLSQPTDEPQGGNHADVPIQTSTSMAKRGGATAAPPEDQAALQASPGKAAKHAKNSPFAPLDPFDPEIFNRLMHSNRAVGTQSP